MSKEKKPKKYIDYVNAWESSLGDVFDSFLPTPEEIELRERKKKDDAELTLKALKTMHELDIEGHLLEEKEREKKLKEWENLFRDAGD